MSDPNSQTSNGTENNDSGEPKKYAGKFDTVEDLEKAYNEFGHTVRENANLKNEITQLRSAPDEYKVPEGIVIQEDDLADLKRISKASNLSQEHFEKMATQIAERANASREKFEGRKKELGEEKLNVLQDFVKKTYPANVQDAILNKCIEDNDAMSQVMNQRDKLLNSKAPGIDSGNTSSGGNKDAFDGQKEVKELASEYLKTNDPKIRERLINVAREVGHERFKTG